jgi:Beta-propeller repeat
MKNLSKNSKQPDLRYLLALAMMPLLTPAYSSQAIPAVTKADVEAHYGQIPLSFEANQGQADSQVKFLSRGQGYGLYLTPTEAVLSLQTAKAENSPNVAIKTVPKMDNAVLRMQWLGGNLKPHVVGRETMAGKVNYLVGKDPANWRTGINTYAKVAYEGVYPGVDLVYYGNQGQLEYDVVVAPKADPKSIHLAFKGADKIKVNDKGELILNAGSHEVQMHKPVIYQEIAGIRNLVAGGYTLSAANEVGFEVGKYDRSRPLVIDPVLAYATLIGGNGYDAGTGIDVDKSGHAYVTGYTVSTDLPTTKKAVQAFFGGTQNAFVSKLNATGTAFDYITYLGGNGYTNGNAIAVDNAGHAYVTGVTRSVDFPTTSDTPQRNNGGGFDAFVAKLNSTGTALDYSTYLGGNGDESGNDIDIDNHGQIYVTGFAGSDNFPTTTGAFQSTTSNKALDVFVVKLNPAETTLKYATYIGGNNVDFGEGIVVDDAGHAYITGSTFSTDFPTTAGAFQTGFNDGLQHAFVVKLNSDGTALDYATYLGGNYLNPNNDNGEGGYGIAVDRAGHAYVTGNTSSASFPITQRAFQKQFGGVYDAFVVKLNTTGTGLDYATFLGGVDRDSANDIDIDSTNHIYVVGNTASTNFPGVVSGAVQTGVNTAFVAKLNPIGTALDYITFLPSVATFDIVVDNSDHAYITGTTILASFPATAGAFQSTINGISDAFISKLNIPNQPKNKGQCKNGWQTFNNPTFKNQGQCVSYVEHLDKNDG